ncbi:MAG TPA: flagellar basal body rod C-terminal domain-containing protein [Ramlibacter sp.]|nr:flagellar basal body rod C-terminal domain-containing protein [Ramlibacter sp.]
MDYLQSLAVSAAGMSLERTRVEAATRNLAFAHTPQAASGGFQPQRVVLRAGWTEALTAAAPQVQLEPSAVPPRLVLEPGHPLADERGFVAYPGVDVATEMVTLMSASRGYEANVAALNTARSMALRTLDIGKGS